MWSTHDTNIIIKNNKKSYCLYPWTDVSDFHYLINDIMPKRSCSFKTNIGKNAIRNDSSACTLIIIPWDVRGSRNESGKDSAPYSSILRRKMLLLKFVVTHFPCNSENSNYFLLFQKFLPKHLKCFHLSIYVVTVIVSSEKP